MFGGFETRTLSPSLGARAPSCENIIAPRESSSQSDSRSPNGGTRKERASPGGNFKVRRVRLARARNARPSAICRSLPPLFFFVRGKKCFEHFSCHLTGAVYAILSRQALIHEQSQHGARAAVEPIKLVVVACAQNALPINRAEITDSENNSLISSVVSFFLKFQ